MTFLWAQDWSDLLQYLRLIVFIFLIIFLEYNDREIELIWLGQILLGVVIVLILITTSNTMVAQGQYLTDTQRAILVIGGVQIDPNYAAMLLFPLGIFICKLLLEDNIQFRFKMVGMVGFMLIIYALLRAGTRGGLLAIIIGGVYYFFKKKTSLGKKIVIIILIIGFSVIIIPRLFLLLPDAITRRFTLNYLLQNGGAGRSEYWKICLGHISDTPWTMLFGHGKQATISLLGIASHNYFVDTLYNGGIIGFCLLIIFYISLLNKLEKMRNIYAQALLIAYISMSMTVSVGANMYFWTGIVVIMLIASMSKFSLRERKR